MNRRRLPMSSATETNAPWSTPESAGVGDHGRHQIGMTHRWHLRNRHSGNGAGGIPPARPCSRRPEGSGNGAGPTTEPADPWLAMDDGLFIRRVSATFTAAAGISPEILIGQPLLQVLGGLGVDAESLSRVESLTVKGRACFVELAPGTLGQAEDHFAMEIRPIPVRIGWNVRYIAVAWSLEGLLDAQGSSAWIPAPELPATTRLQFLPSACAFHRIEPWGADNPEGLRVG